jgi:glycosyltransferase involved in cell wall biosynthesis
LPVVTASAFKVCVKSPFSVMSGYGNDGYGLLRALDRWGADVYPQPVWLDVPIPHDLMPLFGKHLEPPFDLTINHWDPAHLQLTRHAREATRLAVAWTMWEMCPGPADPKSGMLHCEAIEDHTDEYGNDHDGLAKRLQWFDAVLGYSNVTLQALDPYIPETVHRGVLQGGFEAGEWQYMERDWSDDGVFRFGMHGALNRRKEPFLLLQAFLELCDEHPEFKKDARLLFHTNVPGVFPEMNEIYEKSGIGVRVYMAAWDKPTLEQYYQACHALVYPSHGEGKNLPALEHAATGGVELVTDWSGHQEWLNPDYAYPLACTVQPMTPGKPELAHWAVVEIAEVKRVMWHVFTHRAEARAKGELAARLIPQMCSWDAVVENLFRRLRDLVPVQGEIVHNLAMACRRDQQPSLAQMTPMGKCEHSWSGGSGYNPAAARAETRRGS